MPDNVGSISAGVCITHPAMFRIDEFSTVSNLLVWLRRPQAWHHYSAYAYEIRKVLILCLPDALSTKHESSPS